MKTHSIEPLESRIAPASTFVTYTDIDGDLVKITASQATGTPPLDPGDLTFTDGNPDGQLAVLDVTGFDNFAGANIVFSVTKAAGGDGFAHVGYINAFNVDLGNVIVKGDLGAIDAGNQTTPDTTGLKSLCVQSLGRLGTSTGATDLKSDIVGPLGVLKVIGDVKDAVFSVTGGLGGINGTIGSVNIGGGLLGGATMLTGSVRGTGDIGSVHIGGDIAGAAGEYSGFVQSINGKIGPLSVGGSLHGSTGDGSGSILSAGSLGAVKIGRDVIGGGGIDSGTIEADGGTLTSVTIGGSLFGGAGLFSGSIHGSADLGPVKIGHDLKGGDGDESGKIKAGGALTSLTVGGSLIGGAGDQNTNVPVQDTGHAGQVISVGNMGLVRIGGDLIGGTGHSSGRIASQGTLAGLSVHGSIIGDGASTALQNGSVWAVSSIGPVSIGGSIVGGGVDEAGGIHVFADAMDIASLASLTVGGSILGGSARHTGAVVADSDSYDSVFGPVRIGGDVIGGAGDGSGYVFTYNRATSFTIGGSVIGGSGDGSGFIAAGRTTGAVRIGGDVIGGTLTGSEDLYFSGSIRTGGSIYIGGSVFAGVDNGTGALRACGAIVTYDSIKSLTVRGSIVGSVGASGDVTPVLISGVGGFPSIGGDPIAIGNITVGGRVERALILGGYQVSNVSPTYPMGGSTNADAQIGKVTVGGDWIASSLIAGVEDGGDGFGNANDSKIVSPFDGDTFVSRIAGILIKGQALGTPGGTDHYGFVAQEIGSFSVGGKKLPLQPGAGNDLPPNDFAVGLTGDLRVREIATP